MLLKGKVEREEEEVKGKGVREQEKGERELYISYYDFSLHKSLVTYVMLCYAPCVQWKGS